MYFFFKCYLSEFDMSLVHRSRESDRRAEIEVSVYLSRVNFLSEFGFNSDTHTIVTLFTSIEFRNGILIRFEESYFYRVPRR